MTEKDNIANEFSALRMEAVAMLPDGMKEACDLALQAVALNHLGDYRKSQERIKKLRRVSYTSEPYCSFLSAKNEFAIAESIAEDDEEMRRHMARARSELSSFLSSYDKKDREYYEAYIMKARTDYILGYRKGIFMGIIELPEGTTAGEAELRESVKLRGFHMLGSTPSAVLLSGNDGSIFAISLEEPGMLVVAAVAGNADLMETADSFIRISSSVMKAFSSQSFYVNGVMLSAADVEEALNDISENAFPVWFFARGSEIDENGIHIMVAEGAESFGAKAVRIVGVSEEDREEASNALSLILVYHVYSASARRSRSFTINERTYSLVSSDKDSVSFVLDKK